MCIRDRPYLVLADALGDRRARRSLPGLRLFLHARRARGACRTRRRGSRRIHRARSVRRVRRRLLGLRLLLLRKLLLFLGFGRLVEVDARFEEVVSQGEGRHPLHHRRQGQIGLLDPFEAGIDAHHQDGGGEHGRQRPHATPAAQVSFPQAAHRKQEGHQGRREKRAVDAGPRPRQPDVGPLDERVEDRKRARCV